MQYKVAILGEKDVVYPFGMLGMNVFYSEGESSLAIRIKTLIDSGYGVIFLTEKVARQVPEVLKKHEAAFMPALIVIPSGDGAPSLGLQQLQANMKKAVGQNIL